MLCNILPARIYLFCTKIKIKTQNMHLKCQFFGGRVVLVGKADTPVGRISLCNVLIFALYLCTVLLLFIETVGVQQRLLEFQCLNTSANKTKRTLTFCQLVHFQHHKPGYVNRKIIVGILRYRNGLSSMKNERICHSRHILWVQRKLLPCIYHTLYITCRIFIFQMVFIL